MDYIMLGEHADMMFARCLPSRIEAVESATSVDLTVASSQMAQLILKSDHLAVSSVVHRGIQSLIRAGAYSLVKDILDRSCPVEVPLIHLMSFSTAPALLVAALIIAAKEGNNEVVQLLVAHGANAHIMAADGVYLYLLCED